MIRDVQPDDHEAICSIYNHYIEHSYATFEEQPISTDEMRDRVNGVLKNFPWLVIEEEGHVLGYACAGKWHSRAAYRYAVESTIYLSHGATGKGIGTRLYSELIERLRQLDIHCVIGGVAIPNPASVALHEKLGFEKTAHYKQVGWKMNRWIDVGYWQLLLREPGTPP